MNTLSYIFTFLILSITFTNCSDDADDGPVVPDPVEGLHKIYEFSEANHSIEIYSEKTNLEVGYNEIFIRIKKSAGDYLSDAAPSWMPMMQMQNMSHSAPHSALGNVAESTVYNGYIVFQMAENSAEFWELTLNYNFNGERLEKTYPIAVDEPADGLKKTQVFTGIDEVRYVLAYVNPKAPTVALNDMQAVLYKMEDMMNFTFVEDFKITLDPRMPGMGNHSSPNNIDLTYNASTKLYTGKLSLTMTGYWRINLKLLNAQGEVLKGEDVTETNPESSLYFELEL